MPDYTLAGQMLSCDVALDDLALWSGPARVPDIIVRCPSTDVGSNLLTAVSPVIAARKDGLTRLEISNLVVFSIFGARFVGVTPFPACSREDIACFLLGPVLGILAHQREQLPLKASFVLVDGQAVGLAGPPGVGKSSLAIGLERCGYPFISDHISLLQVNAEDACVIPTGCPARLWEDTLLCFGMEPANFRRTRADHRRYYYAPEKLCRTQAPIPVRAIIFLEPTFAESPSAMPITPEAAITRAMAAVSQSQLACFLGQEPRIRRMNETLSRKVRCFSLGRNLSQNLNSSVSQLKELLPKWVA